MADEGGGTATSGGKRKAAEVAAERVRDAILEGRIAAGDHLPGERELSESLGVSRLTLRSALARLEAEGLVRPEHGSGTRVLDFREHGGVDLLGYLARRAIDGGTVPLALLRDLLELRRAIAVEVLGLVAERASDEEVAALRAHKRAQEDVVDDPARFMEADLHFARLAVRASHNLALELLYNTVTRVIEHHKGLEIAFLANARQTLTVYDRLLDLIATRDARRVRRVARGVIERLDRMTLERVAALAGDTRGAEPSPAPSSSDEEEE